MAIRIFYFGVVVFSVMLVFLSLQTPYVSDFFKDELEVADTEMIGIIDYSIDGVAINGEFRADNGIRYSSRDEFVNFSGEILGEDRNHTLTSEFAIQQGDEIRFIKNAFYQSSDDLNYISDEIVYNKITKIITSDKPFVMWQGENNATGLTLKYDLNKKQTFVTGVNAWYFTKE